MRSFSIPLNFQGRTRSFCRRRIAGFAILAMVALPASTVPVSYAADARSRSSWVATWGAAMVAIAPDNAPDLTEQTHREIVHTSVGGNQVRVWFSNRFGSEPLHIGTAHIAVSTNRIAASSPGGSSDVSGIEPDTDRTLTFNQLDSVVIPSGAMVVSDPVALSVPALSNLAVSIYFPDHTMATTGHLLAHQVSYATTGNHVDAPSLAGRDWPETSWYVLAGIDVNAPGDSAVIAFGDSITDGATATENANHRWPDYLAARLADNEATKRAGVLGVVNVGIGGNRVLVDGTGPNAVSRLNRDILTRSGAQYVIVLESINDIDRYDRDRRPYGDLAQRLESGLAQLAKQSQQHGMKVIGATLTPFQGSIRYSAAGEEVRQAVNQWIRTSIVFDGVVDFDKAIRDPQNPLRYAPQYDSGDHLHPNDAGFEALANCVDLSLFTGSK
jgi:lysophospholipase L1-like esterase